MKSKLSAKDLKAINEYMKAHNYKIELSILPIITFTNKVTKEKVDVPLMHIHTWVEDNKEN